MVWCAASGAAHRPAVVEAGVVDEEGGCAQFGGEGAGGLGRASDRHDGDAAWRERAGRHGADAGTGAGDEDGFTGQVLRHDAPLGRGDSASIQTKSFVCKMGGVRRTADQARADILKAAQEEFARYGVDGARIDRIAKQAGASKERLYTYFGDKQELFDEVIRRAVEQVYSAVRVQDDDLVAYAGQLVAHFLTHPANLRMLSWTRLEEQCERALLLDAVAAHGAEKVEAVRRAQATGRVDDGWDPAELLSLILAISSYWATASGPDPARTARYRATVEEAVRRIIEPKPNQ